MLQSQARQYTDTKYNPSESMIAGGGGGGVL